MPNMCEDCFFWEALPENSQVGWCHRNPPDRRNNPRESEEAPVSAIDFWCGEFSAIDPTSASTNDASEADPYGIYDTTNSKWLELNGALYTTVFFAVATAQLTVTQLLNPLSTWIVKKLSE